MHGTSDVVVDPGGVLECTIVVNPKVGWFHFVSWKPKILSRNEQCLS